MTEKAMRGEALFFDRAPLENAQLREMRQCVRRCQIAKRVRMMLESGKGK